MQSEFGSAKDVNYYYYYRHCRNDNNVQSRRNSAAD